MKKKIADIVNHAEVSEKAIERCLVDEETKHLLGTTDNWEG